MPVATLDALHTLLPQLDGLAHLLATTEEALPPAAAHGLAAVLASIADQARAAVAV
jgi:hypothetical protein